MKVQRKKASSGLDCHCIGHQKPDARCRWTREQNQSEDTDSRWRGICSFKGPEMKVFSVLNWSIQGTNTKKIRKKAVVT